MSEDLCFQGVKKGNTGQQWLKLRASDAASEFCEWVQVGVEVYLPHGKYHVKPYSSPWFSVAYPTAINHRNHIFSL